MKILLYLFQIITILTTFHSTQVFAIFEIGTGANSSTSGRIIPGISIGAGTENWLISATSSGVKNTYYYRTTFSISILKTWRTPQLFWGDTITGIGLGSTYSENGFKDDGDSKVDKDVDMTIGPAFKMKWHFLGPGFMSMEAIYGIRRPITHLLSLQFQDFIIFTLGISL